MAAIVVVVVVVVVVIIVDVVVVVIGKQASERHFGMRGWLAFIVSCRAGATKVNSVYDLLVAPIIFPNAPPLSLSHFGPPIFPTDRIRFVRPLPPCSSMQDQFHCCWPPELDFGNHYHRAEHTLIDSLYKSTAVSVCVCMQLAVKNYCFCALWSQP